MGDTAGGTSHRGSEGAWVPSGMDGEEPAPQGLKPFRSAGPGCRNKALATFRTSVVCSKRVVISRGTDPAPQDPRSASGGEYLASLCPPGHLLLVFISFRSIEGFRGHC